MNMNSKYDYMNDYMNEMEKYIKQDKHKKKNECETSENDNVIPIKSNEEKEKLFESFMQFMNNQQNKGSHKILPIHKQTIENNEAELENPEYSENKNEENKKNENLIEIEINAHSLNNSTTCQELKNFDDIPIKPKSQNFIELLEKNLQLEKNTNNLNLNEISANPVIKKKTEYVPRQRRTDAFNSITQPSELKKYKYYSQNFNKDFGKIGACDIEVEELAIPTEKQQSKTRVKEKQKNSTEKPIKSIKHTVGKSNAENKSKANIKKTAGNIWGDLDINQETNKSNDEDEFLNAYTKPKISISTSNKTNSTLGNSVNNTSKKEYEIKMISNKPNINKTQTPIVNQITQQIVDSKKQNHPEDNATITIPSNTMKNSLIEEPISSNNSISISNANTNNYNNGFFKQSDGLSLNDNQDENNESINEIEDDDSRDIIKMYENTNTNINNYKLQEKIESPSNNNLYKKPEQHKIINKYFKPFLKENKPTVINKDPNSFEHIPGQDLIVNEKINELNREIEKLQKENEKVLKLKTEYDKITKKLNREVEEFYKKKEKEMQEYEQWKEEEMKKIEKEKKVHLRNTKLLQNMPNRKEREEIENLKEQVLKLQEEMKSKDMRNKLAMERLKKQIDESNRKNEELQKELKLIEELRIKNMGINSNKSTNEKKMLSNQNNQTSLITNTNNTIRMSNNKSSKNLIDVNNNNNCNNLPSNSNSNTKINKSNLINSIPNQKIKLENVNIGNFNDKRKSCSLINKINSNENTDLDIDNHSELDNEDVIDNGNDYYNYHNHYNDNNATNTRDDNIMGNKYNNEIHLQTAFNKPKKVQVQDSQSENLAMTKKIDENAEIKMTKVKLTKTPLNVDNSNNSSEWNGISASNKQSKVEKFDSSTKNRNRHFDSEQEENYEMIFPDKYHNKSSKNVRLIKQDFTEDGKIIKLFENMKKEIIFPSGVKKEIFEDGYTITYFNNKDIKQIYADSREVYLFSENKTIQFKYPDGLQVFKFEGGQIEKHYPDGTKIVSYTDGTIRNVYADGYEETFFTDGSLQKVDKSGIITIDYEDGLKDIIYPDGSKVREFPDGRIKKILPEKTTDKSYR